METGLLWTCMPLELVLEGLEPKREEAMEMVVQGRLLQVRLDGNGRGTVQRLISSQPQDYLDPRWQPGVVLSIYPSE